MMDIDSVTNFMFQFSQVMSIFIFIFVLNKLYYMLIMDIGGATNFMFQLSQFL